MLEIQKPIKDGYEDQCNNEKSTHVLSPHTIYRLKFNSTGNKTNNQSFITQKLSLSKSNSES